MPVQLDRTDVQRRRVLLRALAAVGAPWMMSQAPAHEAFGPVTPPLAAPRISLIRSNGMGGQLAPLLRGRVTAVQLMFTGCSATCPIQGAVFAAAQQQLANESAELQLVSISIDPLGDDLKALQTWLQRFEANPQRWTAAVPNHKGADQLLNFLRGRATGADRHTPQTYIFDREARLAYRTQDLPSTEQVIALMRQVASMR